MGGHFSNSHVAGLVLAPPFSESSQLIEALLARKVSFVRILSGSTGPEASNPSVYIDDYRGAYQVTDYLVGLGHRRIGFLGEEKGHRSSLERLNGYRAALRDNAIAVHEELVIAGEYSFDSGVKRTRQLLGWERPPTAIFACKDEIAAGALFAERAHQVAVPQALSIVGFEDRPFSRQTWPRLTTAHQPDASIAETAAHLLIDSIRRARQDDDGEALPDNRFLPQLVVRESSGPAPA